MSEPDIVPDVEIVRLEPSGPPQSWTIEKGKSFAYRFVDESGKECGRYRDADTMAAHYVFALQRIERMQVLQAELASIARRAANCFDDGTPLGEAARAVLAKLESPNA